MAEQPGALGLDFLTQIVNVQWGGLHFLYSGVDGMHGSEDGNKWEKLKTGAVPAKALAWADDVWLAIDDNGPWRSEDGGKTWGQVKGGHAFEQIAACEASVTDEEGKKVNGVFAGYKMDDDGDNEEVYISKDLGKTWSKALNIPTTIPYVDGDGSEFATVLSGCGNGIFLSTIKRDTLFSSGDGCVYVSRNGGAFARQQVWTGTTRFFDDPDRAHTIGYTAGAVGFDSKTKRFCLMYYKQEGFGPGGAAGSVTHYSIGYAIGSGGSFSGETEIVLRIKGALDDSYQQVVGGLAAAGGGGKFAGVYEDRSVNPSPPLPSDLTIKFFGGGGSGSQILISALDVFQGVQIGPVCWKPGSPPDEGEEGAPPPEGTFACFAASAETGTGVWIAKSGGWSKTHSAPSVSSLRGLAVGRLSWLGSQEEPT